MVKKEGIKKFLIANIFFIFALAFIYRSYILRSEPFELYADYVAQHIPFYEEFFRLLKEGNIGWSWNTFLGTNFYGSKGYYMVGDVFAYLCYFINLIFNNTIYSMFIMTLIKLYFGFVGFYLFLRKHNINYLISGLFALTFVCSGWVGLFVEQPMFISVYVYIPYILLGLERIVYDKKPLIFIVGVALMISTNFYLAWSFCFFLLLYWIIRYLQIKDKFIFNEFIKESLKILGYFLVGVLLSAIIWLPTVYHVSQSPRTQNGGTIASYGWLWSFRQVLRILQNFFVPFVGGDNASLYKNEWYYFNQVGLYAGMLPLISTGVYCLKKNKNKTEKLNAILVVICLLTLVSPKIGKIFLLTYSLRYFYYVLLAMLIVGATYVNEIYKNGFYNKKELIIISLVSLTLSIVLCFVIPNILGYDITIYSEFKPYIKSMICILIYFVILMFIKNKKVVLALLLLFSTYEITSQYKTQIRNLHNFNIQVIGQYNEYKSDTLHELVDYIKSIDYGFYRINFACLSNRNLSMTLDMPTVSTYDSTYEFAIEPFLDLLRLYPDVDWNFSLEDPTLYSLLDVKYVISNSYDFLTYGEVIYTGADDWKIYLVNKDNYLLRSYNNFLDFDELMEMSKDWASYYLFEITDKLTDAVAIDNKYVDEFTTKYKDSQELKLNPDVVESNYVCFNFECKDDEFIYLSIPNDKGWTIKDNGEKLESISSNGGFIGLEISAGTHKLELTYTVPYLKVGQIISCVGLVLTIALEIISKKRHINN